MTSLISMLTQSLESRILRSLNRSTAMIHFDRRGRILDANSLFLTALGYERNEIVGKHHSMFLAPEESSTEDYQNFWMELARGRSFSGEFRRLDKHGNEVWIEATYNPVYNLLGRVTRVVKLALITTDRKLKEIENTNLLAATDRSFAIIEFDCQGKILHANDNFLRVMGYSLEQIVDKHHRIFIDPHELESEEYEAFWMRLRNGEPQIGQFKRLGNAGQSVWIEASYNPVFDSFGRVSKIVKYATDITDVTNRRLQAETISVAISASSSQFTQTINEINVNVSRTACLSSEAKTMTEGARDAVAKLDESSRVIGRVTETIKELAEQTNLLALNANIESARAGQAGRGFAVVATAVKDLAMQTGQATRSIAETVETIQRNVLQVVESTDGISRSVSEVNNNMNVIAAAVEEQSVTMKSISDTAIELRDLSRC